MLSQYGTTTKLYKMKNQDRNAIIFFTIIVIAIITIHLLTPSMYK